MKDNDHINRLIAAQARELGFWSAVLFAIALVPVLAAMAVLVAGCVQVGPDHWPSEFKDWREAKERQR